MKTPNSPLFHAPLLVGRERELGILRQHLEAALAGQGNLVLIGGEAGIGKTALAEVLCAEATAHGARVLTGRCFDLAETPPYGPWTDLFGTYTPGTDLPALPAAFAKRGTIGDVTSQSALSFMVQDFFTTLAARGPLLLLLDDLHWADPASLDLLRLLTRTLAHLPLLVLVTYRGDELTRHHPLYTLLPVLERESGATRLDLRRLSHDAVRALVAARYPSSAVDADRLVRYLHARAEGNAFFTIQLLRALEEGGVLRSDNDAWVVGDLDGLHVPLALRQVIAGRLARLGEEAQRLLGIAAVIGQEVPLEAWAAVAGVDEVALTMVVERAVEAHLLEETADGIHARFVHALIREALYEEILPSRRRRLHRQVAEALERLPAPDFDALAYHYRQAGDERAERWLVVAGVRAQYAGAVRTASGRFEAALRLLEARGGHVIEQGWLLVYQVRMAGSRDPERSLSYLDAAERLAAPVADPALIAWIARSRGSLWCWLGELRAGIAEMLRGEEIWRDIQEEERPWLHGFPSPPTVAGDLTFHALSAVGGGVTVNQLALAGRVTEACRRGEEIVAPESVRAAQRSPVNVPLAELETALWGLGLAYATLGRPAEAREAMHGARARSIELSNQWSIYMSFAGELRLVHVPYQTERVAERQRMIAGAEHAWALASAARGNLPDPIVRHPIFRVDGQWPLVRDVVGMVPVLGERSILGQFAYWQGDDEIAWTLIDELLPDGPATEPGDSIFFNAIELQRAAAALAIDAGNLAVARAWLEADDRWLAWSGAVIGLADGAIAWAGYYRVAGDAEQARAHAERALVYAAEPRQPLALIGAHRVLGELATDAGRFDEAAKHLNDALTLGEACAAPFDRALTLLALAELHAATGQREAALRLLDAVRHIGTPLHALPLLARAAALTARLDTTQDAAPAYPAGLSAREVEVLRLIAAGQTNRAIAAALFLSRHTVGIHVTHILQKTNSENRAAAASFALRHGLI